MTETPSLMRGGGHRLVLVTGPSGSGRATAVRALEDLDCEVIDNLPLSLVPRLLEGPALGRTLVLGIDIRNRDFSTAGFLDTVAWLRAREAAVEVVFLDCSPEVLQRRFSETRRRHPLAPSETAVEGIDRETGLLAPVRDHADILIDTTDLTPHDLKVELARWFDPRADKRLSVTLHSFSYKRGMPRGIDTVFDCRFLQNPYWEPGLKELDGRNPRVADYVASDPRYAQFFRYVTDMAEFLLPAYIDEGKAHLAIGFGCTGGQHRSVALVERLGASLETSGWAVNIRHHELERRARLRAPSTRGDAA